ncbi:MAG: response regulator transcription factor [Robiginitomaculum sp.]|nr:response regulator transcription factor [Robiginitomaculum sp.]
MADLPNILIIEDHPLFQDALEAALQQCCPLGVETQKASSLTDGIALIDQVSFNLILLDLNLSDSKNFEGLGRIHLAEPNCPIAIVSATELVAAYQMAKSLGASGYLPKSMPFDDMVIALSNILNGVTSFPSMQEKDTANHADVNARLASLTPAQRRVLSGLADGLLNKQIAYEMGITIATVKAHMTAIFRKLGATNRTQALLIYKDATDFERI